jgi:hypothetical protein
MGRRHDAFDKKNCVVCSRHDRVMEDVMVAVKNGGRGEKSGCAAEYKINHVGLVGINRSHR